MRKLGMLFAVVAFTACSKTGTTGTNTTGQSQSPTNITTDDTLTISLGQTASTRDGRFGLTFAQLVDDSRCPANAVCVWEGDAAVRLRAATTTDAVEATIHTRLDPKVLEVRSYTVSLLEVQPYPGTGNDKQTPRVVVRVVR
jgi:hypothetical protein